MYTMRAARGPYVNDMYFIFVVMFGSLFMLNLVVAVLVANFDADREKEDKRGSFIPPEGVSPKDEKRPEAPPSAIAAMATTTRQQSRRAAACGRAQLLAKRGFIGQMQISAELVPIPDASGCVPMRPGCVGMRRDASGF